MGQMVLVPCRIKEGDRALRIHWEKQATKEDLQKIALLDAVTLNCDRSESNFLVAPNGEVAAFDNARAFSRLKSKPFDHIEGSEILSSIRKRVERFRTAPEVQAALQNAFNTAFAEQAPDQWQAFIDRLNYIVPSDVALPGIFRDPQKRARN